MKSLILIIVFMSQYSMAARILEAFWQESTQKVVMSMAYHGGCLPHEFSVAWDECAADGTRFGQIIDAGSADECEIEQVQIFSASEPDDGCVASALVLKSTSSKAPVTIEK